MAPCLCTTSVTSIVPNATTGAASGCVATAGSDSVVSSPIKVAASLAFIVPLLLLRLVAVPPPPVVLLRLFARL
jgi:hypothetical protein